MPNSTANSSGYLDARPSLAEQLIVAEQHNSELIRLVSESAWGRLRPDEQDNITILAAHFFPDDIEARQQAIRLHLVKEQFQYLREMAILDLEGKFSAPETPHPHNDHIS